MKKIFGFIALGCAVATIVFLFIDFWQITSEAAGISNSAEFKAFERDFGGIDEFGKFNTTWSLISAIAFAVSAAFAAISSLVLMFGSKSSKHTANMASLLAILGAIVAVIFGLVYCFANDFTFIAEFDATAYTGFYLATATALAGGILSFLASKK